MVADGFNENGEIVVPDCVRGALRSLVSQIDALQDEAIGAIDRELTASVKAGRDGQAVDDHSRRRPSHRIGVTATIQDASAFASGREFAAFALAGRRARTRPAAKRGSGASQRWATAICASFWW